MALLHRRMASPAADAMVATGCSSDAQGSHIRRQRQLRLRLMPPAERWALRPVSERGMTDYPRFLDGFLIFSDLLIPYVRCKWQRTSGAERVSARAGGQSGRYRLTSGFAINRHHQRPSPTDFSRGEMQNRERRCGLPPALAAAFVLPCAMVAVSAAPRAAVDSPGGPSEPLNVGQIVLLLVAGRLLGEVMQRVGQPAIMGQLLAGVLLGPSALGAAWPQAQQAIFPSGGSQKVMIDGVAQLEHPVAAAAHRHGDRHRLDPAVRTPPPPRACRWPASGSRSCAACCSAC